MSHFSEFVQPSKTFSDHVTRDASASHNNEAQGLGKGHVTISFPESALLCPAEWATGTRSLSLTIILHLFCLFFTLSPLTPLQKGLNLGERQSPLFHFSLKVSIVCYRSQLARKRSQAAENSWRKQQTKLHRIKLPPAK